MVLYSVTLSLEPSIEQDWLTWMREIHIPDVIATKCFEKAYLSRVHAEEQGGVTYSVIYKSISTDHYNQYQNIFAPKLQKEHSEKFLGKFVAFRTELKIIEEFSI